MPAAMGNLARYILENCRTSSTAVLCAICTFCAILPLSIPQLVILIVLAVAYAILQEFRGRKVPAKIQECSHARRTYVSPPRKVALPNRSQMTCNSNGLRHSLSMQLPPTTVASSRSESCNSSSQHSILPRVEQAPLRTRLRRDLWEREVDELLASIAPTAASNRMVRELARSVQQIIRSTLPEAEVVGVSSGDLAGRCSIGMGDPEVDLVVFVNPNALPAQLKGRLSRSGMGAPGHIDSRKVQKSAIRACTDRLVSVGGFKFRRSAFRGQEPKVTLLAPVSPSTFYRPVATAGQSGTKDAPVGDEIVGTPIDLSVNTMMPVYSEALQLACGRMDRRAKELIALVKRWARDRGISHEAKGHLSPFAWSLLATFFLQVTPTADGFILPPLEGIQVDKSNVIVQRAPALAGSTDLPNPAEMQCRRAKVEHKSVSTLFIDFVHFYGREFNWRSEAVSIGAGRRAVPDLSLPLHIIISSAGIPTQVGPHIQNPFEPKNNLGTSMTAEGFARLQEEFSRGISILTRESPEPSLKELIEPWVAPNASADLEGDMDSVSASHRGSEASMISQYEKQALLMRS